MDVGQDAFERVVLRGRNDLQRSGMNHERDVAHRELEPRGIAHVADEESQPRRGLRKLGPQLARHAVLLLFVTREDDQAARQMVRKQIAHHALSERACSTGDQNRCVGKVQFLRLEISLTVRPRTNWSCMDVCVHHY